MANADKAVVNAETSGADKDLDDLLDSALTDFDRPLPKMPVRPSASSTKISADNSKNTEGAEWSSEFAQFQNVMENILKSNPKLEDLEANVDPAILSKDLGASLADTIKAISESAQTINQPSVEDFSQLFKSMGLEDGDGAKGDQIPDLMPLMENVMQSLLSKELLYPALKDIVNKYPDWLAENQSVLEEELFQKYSTQYELMKKVCEEFEASESATSEEGASSFPKILTLMQKMQECGNPPKELVGDLPSDLPFDEDGNMKLPGMPEQCTIM